MFCGKCGLQVEDGAMFCPNCGTKFNADAGTGVQQNNVSMNFNNAARNNVMNKGQENQLKNTMWIMDHMYALKISVLVGFLLSLAGMLCKMYEANVSVYGMTLASVSGNYFDYTKESGAGVLSYTTLGFLVIALLFGLVGKYLPTYIFNILAMLTYAFTVYALTQETYVSLNVIAPILYFLGFGAMGASYLEMRKVKKYRKSMGIK